MTPPSFTCSLSPGCILFSEIFGSVKASKNKEDGTAGDKGVDAEE